MSTKTDSTATAKKEDKTGRSQLVRNVGASYVGHTILVVFGFIMPRVIDQNIGQVGLGIWDFCWTFVNYLNLSMMGIGTSVNRYVARYRASGDSLALSRIVSTVIGIQLAIATFVLLASFALARLIPVAFADRLGDDAAIAGWVVGLLGSSLAIQMAFNTWRGVLSGCHRWDYHNALNAGSSAASSIIMIIVLVLGGGLVSIAWVYLGVTVVSEILRFIVARQVCPEARISPSLMTKHDAVKATKFGLKSIMLALPDLIVIQSVSIFVVANLGPAALAILARPLALARHITTFIMKYAFVLTPTAGSLQSQGKAKELAEFALQSSRNGWLLTIPPITFLFMMGDLIMEVWMGPGYVNWGVSAVLAAGLLLPISQSPLTRIMVGMDKHGTIARAGLIVSAIVLIIGLAIIETSEWSLIGAAALIAITLGIGRGTAVLFYGFRFLDIGLREYCAVALKRPLVLLVALVAGCLAVRSLSPYSAVMTLAFGAATTGLVSLVILKDDVSAVIRSIRSE